MTLPAFQLFEPLCQAVVTLLAANLNTTIENLNNTVTDGYTVDLVQQILPYVPPPAQIAGGLPAVGVQELGAGFQDDDVFWTAAKHRYAVVAIVQNTDHASLTWQLRRTMQAILYTLQADRLAGTVGGGGGIMRSQGGAYSVNLVETEPGPLLADLDPNSPESPPRSYLSWTAVVCESVRDEQRAV